VIKGVTHSLPDTCWQLQKGKGNGKGSSAGKGRGKGKGKQAKKCPKAANNEHDCDRLKGCT